LRRGWKLKKGAIVGKVKNTSTTRFEWVTLEFSLHNWRYERIETVCESVTSLKPGEVYKFKVPYFASGVWHCRVADLSCVSE